MVHCSSCMAVLLLLLLSLQISQAHPRTENGVKTEVSLTPEIVLEPGSVNDKYYYGVDFPRGHIAIKGFNAELVDEKGNPVPLHETYLHHWVLNRYYQKKGINIQNNHGDLGFNRPDHIPAGNSGICDNGLSQYYGLGSETRKTDTDIPDPFGIEVGNPVDIPPGYEAGWVLNVHAIDTRGVVDRWGCTECRCALYNETLDEDSQPLPAGYRGGLRCCPDGTRCRVKEGFNGVKRSLYLRYTVKYVDWDSSVVPVKIYILDVTDLWTRGDESRGIRARHQCLVEYDVETCPIDEANDGCFHSKSLVFSSPIAGDVIYGVGHQHASGTGISLYGEGGRLKCSSIPIYGKGDEPGDEAGYVVGMSTCYPERGSIKISAGETLTLVSNYSNAQAHTGVMGLFYLLLAQSSPKPSHVLLQGLTEVHKSVTMSHFVWPIALFGVALVVVVIFVLKSRRGRGEGYEAML